MGIIISYNKSENTLIGAKAVRFCGLDLMKEAKAMGAKRLGAFTIFMGSRNNGRS